MSKVANYHLRNLVFAEAQKVNTLLMDAEVNKLFRTD